MVLTCGFPLARGEGGYTLKVIAFSLARVDANCKWSFGFGFGFGGGVFPQVSNSIQL